MMTFFSFEQEIVHGTIRYGFTILLNFDEKCVTKFRTVFSGILRYENAILSVLYSTVLFQEA